MSVKNTIKPLSIALLAACISACSSYQAAPVAKAEASLNNEDWYLVRTEEKLFLFDDYKVYRDFLVSGNAPVIKDLGEKDKHGQSIVLGLRAEDSSKKLEDISAYRFLRQNMPPAGKFYGEIRQEGVIFVGQRYGDMVDLNNIGEPIFRHTEIASGPNGERVIYLMQKEEKKPDALIKQFQQNYGIAPAS
jgi:hypothetical protein